MPIAIIKNKQAIATQKIKGFTKKDMIKLREQAVKEILDFIDKHYLSYCRQHNGLPYCKNCGLSIDGLNKLKEKYER